MLYVTQNPDQYQGMLQILMTTPGITQAQINTFMTANPDNVTNNSQGTSNLESVSAASVDPQSYPNSSA